MPGDSSMWMQCKIATPLSSKGLLTSVQQRLGVSPQALSEVNQTKISLPFMSVKMMN
jgi:hypothetical protein